MVYLNSGDQRTLVYSLKNTHHHKKMAVSSLLIDCVAMQCMLGKLTETCPDITLGLIGDVTEMDGPTF